AGIFERQIERKRTANAGRAAKLDLAAEQIGELAADRQPQAGTAVFSAGARIRLLEGLEDDLLLLRRNAHAGIGDLEGDDGGSILQGRVLRAPTGYCGRYAQPHPAMLGEFEGVRQQVL